ncbi:tetratricopeptide repeat protein [Novosphingobium sp. EMRT-2]|uniref:tetratricopeptide repeat protein n=1 Tax=Novosphingobium sp. EMRT-2 TaxID=2571749 RepID=UPI0010BDC9FA|nr:tetratricopeptide repeat protein [Novosphingobium sp. EMRT-2]QCI95104.1 tetratricopeptide repeat protein [Novosphingobium sp. EMRT-2]
MKKALILPALLVLAACGSETPQQHLDRAQAAFKAEDYRTARKELGEAVSAAPEDARILDLLARVQLRLGDGEGAQATLARLEAAGAKGPEIARMKADAALLRGQTNEALSLLANDGHPEAWRIRASALLANRDEAGALEAYRKGLAAGGDARLVRDYARFLLDSQDIAGAEAQLADLRRRSPDALDTLMLAGDIDAQANRWGGALAAYKRAQSLYPTRPEPLLAQADAADQQGKLDEAEALVARANDVAPESGDVLRMRIQIAAERGDWEKVRSTLAPRESSLEPRSPEGLAYAEALLRLGRAEQARAIYAKALLLSPQNPFARLMLAEAQLATGDAATAYATVKPLADSAMAGPRELELAEKAARAAGNPAADTLKARLQSGDLRRTQQLAATGQAAMARGDWDAAIAAYQQVSGYQADAEVLKRLAFAASQAGRNADAIGFADKALALQPSNADMIHLAGLVRFRAGTDRDKAVTYLEQALRADPANRLFRNDLARAKAG